MKYTVHKLPSTIRLITIQPTTWRRVLLEKPTVAQLVKKFAALYI
jgi:hypothetical protein